MAIPVERLYDAVAAQVEGTPLDDLTQSEFIRLLMQLLEVGDLGDDAYPTNCCFGGEDRRTLFTTELAPGRVCAVEGLPTPGLALTPWPA